MTLKNLLMTMTVGSKQKSKFLFVFLLICTGEAMAFDLMPSQQSVIDTARVSEVFNDISSEYSSDVQTFSWPAAYHSRGDNSGIWLSLGSLSSKEFLVEQLVQFNKNLTQKLQFDFNWWQQGNYDQTSDNFVWSLSYRLPMSWRLGVLGNSFYQKARNDLGFMIEKTTANQKKIIFSIFQPDFQRNKRADTSKRWGEEPVVYYLELQGHESSAIKKIFYRLEPEFTETDTASSDVYKAERNTFGTDIEKDFFYLQTQFENKIENVSGADSKYQFWQARWGVQTSDASWPMTRWPMEFGLAYYSRLFDLPSEGKVKIQDVIPFVWLYLKQWGVGLDASNHLHSEQKDQVESRLNLKWSPELDEKSQLSLFFTFDVDSFSGQPWEGGGATFATWF